MIEKAKIWVDADACPNVIKDILYRAANRTETIVTLIANHALQAPRSKYIQHLQVPQGFDVADQEIVDRVLAGDLVITSDIPLADEVISKGAVALSPRGQRFTQDNIKQRLNMRDFMETLRSSGIQSGGPSKLDERDKKMFAGELDTWLNNRQTR